MIVIHGRLRLFVPAISANGGEYASGVGRASGRPGVRRPDADIPPNHCILFHVLEPKGVSTMNTKEYLIEGMTCQHCVMAARKELSKIEGITVLDVAIGKATVQIDSPLVTDEVVAAAIEEAGYKLVS
jgi:copper chaperone